MTRQRAALYVLLLVVAAAAAVLSFDALRGLALVCGFAPELAWLLPVVVDAGAAAGSLAWLAAWTPAPARAYGRVLALLLLGSSVAGNALGHGLEAYAARPHWLVVVAVSAIAPAVLGALVHLVVQVGRPVTADESGTQVVDAIAACDFPRAGGALEVEPASLEETQEAKAAELINAGYGRKRLADELGVSEWEARDLITAHRQGRETPDAALQAAR